MTTSADPGKTTTTTASPATPLAASTSGRAALSSLLDALALAALAVVPLAAGLGFLRATFASPRGLALFGLAAPLVVLHLLKPKRQRRVVGSVLLWREVERALEAKHPFQRLRRNLPLFLQLLALASLAVALATPLVPGGRGGGHDLVLVLDASASMKARDGPGGVTRFEAARAEARELVRGLRAGDRGLILVATPRGPRTAQGWTDDKPALEDALAALEATDGGAELGDTLVLAAAASRPLGDRALVHLFTDGGGPPVPALDWGARLRYRALGTTGENVGIVALELREVDDADAAAGAGTGERAGRKFSVFASIENAGERARQVWVELRPLTPPGAAAVPDTVLAARKVELAPRGRAAALLEARLAPGPVRVVLTPARGDPEEGRALDVFDRDDEAIALVPASSEATVALVSPAHPGRVRSPLERALAACSGVRVERREASDVFDPALRLVVFDGVVPAQLPPVSCLFVNPPASVGPVHLGESVLGPRVSAWDRDDRLLRFADLSDVEVSRARRLTLGPGARALVSSEDLPLVATYSEGDAARVVVGFDLTDSSWPLRLSFPVFVRNCVLAALADEALGPRGTIRAGTTAALRALPGVQRVRVTTPRGRQVEVPVEDGRALFAETDEAGLYRVQAGDRESSFTAAVLDEEETRIAPRASLVTTSGEVESQAASDVGRRELVAPFLVLALLALLVEGFAFHRRW